MRPIVVIAQMVIKEIFRKKDFYVALILIAAILFYASQMNFYDAGKVSRYLEELGLFLIFLFSVILTSMLAARQYPAEIQNRTAYVLLAKPVSRTQFIVGKFLGSLAAGWMAFTVFYVLFLSIISAKSTSAPPWVLAAQTYYLFLLCLMVMAALASAFSYILTVAANATLCLVMYILINSYGPSLRESSAHLFLPSRLLGEFFYFAMPHFEFFDLRQRFIHEWPPLSPGLLLFLTGYALLWTSFFLLCSRGFLKKRAL